MKTIPQANTPSQVQLFNWILRPLAYMDTNYQRFGDIFRARGSLFDWIFVSHPDALKDIFTQDTDVFSAPGNTNRILQPLLGNHSLIMTEGNAHQRQRQLVMPPFHGERLKVYGDLIRDITRDVMADLVPGQGFRARSLMQKISMRVILQAVFGLYEGSTYQRLETLLQQRLNMTSGQWASLFTFFPALQRNLGSWSPGHKIQVISAEIDALLFAEIQQRRANLDPSRTDILTLLLLAHDDKGKGMSDRELRDELMTLLVAGHETTATAMAWSLYWAHRYPTILTQLRAEIEELGTDPDPLALTKLPYLSAFCNETLRIYPVGMLAFARRVEKDTSLLGYELPVGELLMGCIYLLHHREDLYPNPSEFRPERFLERQFSPFEFMPFGAGSRRCVGSALALYEMKIVLGTLLPAFELALASNRPVQPQRRGITLAMQGGVEMIFRGPRQPAMARDL